MGDKLTSRKFWICVAAFLGSIATSVAGITTSNEVITAFGIVCGVVSAAIYAAAEAYVDGASVKATQHSYEEKVSVTETSKGTALTDAAAKKVDPTPAAGAEQVAL